MSKRILVIDDEADVRTFLSTVLKKHGYEVTTANNGTEGMKIVREVDPSLITLDLMMPKQSGTDMYRKLKKDAALARIPVIIISGLSGRHLAVPEPLAVFDKPIDPSEFIEVVDGALDDD